MDRARHKSSPSSERLLGSFLPPSAAGDQPGSVAFELDEDDLFASGAPSPERPQPPRWPLLISSIRAANPSPTIPRLRRPPGGILEALPERFGPLSPPLSSSSTSSSPASPVTALPRMIPSIPRPAPAPAMHMPQSAPVNVPAARLRRPPVVDEFTAEADDDDDEEMLPPHEMVARSRARESPMTTFSVLEGAGRTLKGRDLRQPRGGLHCEYSQIMLPWSHEEFKCPCTGDATS
ncbi:CASP-like protein 4A2 isoform X2 [Brachypodium distachyon]|uniref:CASP-like protein 4A2 isoform X2 n=1 Tax=Brachypodium distachyon TaxID=15368 RepID=UPI000D0CA57A|nr:CASP-like protein 4A2 isoform X2 [Brachypodium distachyon]|eukprot:XP_024313930.1 CASP-like protein 4A2 isoform X2 [Brachypodium distachyon]